MEKMISYSKGNIHDIDHFVRVWNYAKTIAELEKLDSQHLPSDRSDHSHGYVLPEI